MKKMIFSLFAIAILLSSCGNQDSGEITVASADSLTIAEEKVQTSMLRFNESTLPYDGGVLLANFGTAELDPLNAEGLGYIAYYKNDSIMNFIPADGSLSAPKGMQILNGYLFIADVGKMVAYKIDNPSQPAITTPFPAGETFVNDIAADGTTLYISVTNTGNIFRIDASDTSKYSTLIPTKFANVPGANGLLVHNNTMYVASYPADGNTTDANTVYAIKNMKNPKPEKLIEPAGQYDGLAISADGNTLYVSNWTPVAIQSIDLKSKQIKTLEMENEMKSAADISIEKNWLYIPDLVASQLIIKAL